MQRLAIAERLGTSGLGGVAVLLIGACLIGVASMSGPETTDACRFEQTWYAGDVHYNERIELRVDSTGTWLQNGMASEKPPVRKEFTWARTASTFSVVYDDQERTVEYRIEPRRTSCWLKFKAHPFGDRDGFTHFSNTP
jgi:hypothetical protein